MPFHRSTFLDIFYWPAFLLIILILLREKEVTRVGWCHEIEGVSFYVSQQSSSVYLSTNFFFPFILQILKDTRTSQRAWQNSQLQVFKRPWITSRGLRMLTLNKQWLSDTFTQVVLFNPHSRFLGSPGHWSSMSLTWSMHHTVTSWWKTPMDPHVFSLTSFSAGKGSLTSLCKSWVSTCQQEEGIREQSLDAQIPGGYLTWQWLFLELDSSHYPGLELERWSHSRPLTPGRTQ